MIEIFILILRNYFNFFIMFNFIVLITNSIEFFDLSWYSIIRFNFVFHLNLWCLPLKENLTYYFDLKIINFTHFFLLRISLELNLIIFKIRFDYFNCLDTVYLTDFRGLRLRDHFFIKIIVFRQSSSKFKSDFAH